MYFKVKAPVFGFEGANVTFDGATDNFHTRLVRDKSSYDLSLLSFMPNHKAW